MANRRVLVTGATGHVASQLLPAFRERYDLMLLDIRQGDSSGGRVESVTIADLSATDQGEYQRHFQGIDTVVHLAYIMRPGIDMEHFYDEHLNVRMAYNVYRAAHESGVKRVVVASSNQAANWTEHTLIHKRKRDMLDPCELPLSRNFYGWSKAACELLAYPFASGSFGRRLEVVQVRIGYPQEVSGRGFAGDLQAYKRHLGAYISQRDLCQLFVKAIETSNIENEHGVPWLVVYGISDNTRSFWSLNSARRVLGYDPEDDSEIKYADDVRRHLTAEGSSGGAGRVGT